MTPTLIDITMITGLDVTSSANPMSLNTKNQYDFRTKSIGGWSGYVAAYVGQGSVTPRECMSYGEYASTPADTGAKLSAELLKDWLCSFYEGFQKNARIWFSYEDSAHLELPSDFRFEDINYERYQKSREVFSAAISPCIFPVGIHQGRNIQVSYEFYHPMSSARQLGMGQLPIGLFFANKIQCRGEISSTLMMDRLLNLQGPPLGSIENIELATFWSKAFDRWWCEWKLHLFHQSASMYIVEIMGIPYLHGDGIRAGYRIPNVDRISSLYLGFVS
uniref:OSJNBb0093G06.2 protein n=1 Tax=Oryza sativa subsp. japonica TaxID=39947 RepID=Q7X6A6_ORYSJ|nr:OSJNBb0093G06.2 [Oryza sativa Japonica Group]